MAVEREIRCRSALTPEGWIAPACIRLDATGFIESVAPLDAAAGSGVLAGHIVPGLPNLHSHAFQRQMAGSAESGSGSPDSFWTWREAMYRLASRVDPDQLEAIAAWVQAEMLEAGYTSCAEFHYLHHQPNGKPYRDRAEMSCRLLAATASSGIALTLLPVLYCRSGFGAGGVEPRQRRFHHVPGDYLELVARCRQAIAGHPLHRVGIAPHSLRAVSREDLRPILEEPANRHVPVHIHIAEQPAEVSSCLAFHGAPPVAYLLREFDVDERWCLVHATHMEPDELRAAATSRAVAGLCPTTEANLGDGSFPGEAWLNAGGRFGVGSDSNVRMSAAEELRALELQARLRALRRIVLATPPQSCGRSLYEQAAAGGGQALGQPVGRIAPGCRGDFVELDAQHVLLAQRSGDAVLDTFVFADDGAMIRTVWVAGQAQVRDGRHLCRARLEAAFRKAMAELS